MTRGGGGNKRLVEERGLIGTASPVSLLGSAVHHTAPVGSTKRQFLFVPHVHALAPGPQMKVARRCFLKAPTHLVPRVTGPRWQGQRRPFSTQETQLEQGPLSEYMRRAGQGVVDLDPAQVASGEPLCPHTHRDVSCAHPLRWS